MADPGGSASFESGTGFDSSDESRDQGLEQDKAMAAFGKVAGPKGFANKPDLSAGFVEKFGGAALDALDKYLGSGGVMGLFGKGIFSTLQEKFPDLEIGTNMPQKPEGGDGPPTLPSVPVNPIEDLVGSEYVAYGGIGAEELRKQLFPYMNFNQPTQPGIQGLVGQYAGVGKGTGLMTGPFGMSNTQV